jgi:uncharacterized membrane protein YbhN (UPF0104 family)
MIKVVIRLVILLTICFGFLYLMHRLELLRLADILNAFNRRPELVFLLVIVQCFSALVMLVRYASLLRILGISVSLKQVSSATFVSTAVGQWAPGSLAVVELLRLGLMIGSHSSAVPAKDAGAEAAGMKARLTIASFADRLIGFLGILLTGFLGSVYLFFNIPPAGDFFGLLSGPGLLLVSSAAGVFAIIVMPFTVRMKFFRNFSRRMRIHGPSSQTAGGKFWNAALRHFETFRHNIDAGSRHPWRLLGPLALSVVSLLLGCLMLNLAARALGESIDFLQIVAAFPLIAVTSLLPLGFAGIGGYQLITASIFSLFAVSPAVVASSGVLQSAVILVVNTVIGLFFARVCSHQIRTILTKRTPVESI